MELLDCVNLVHKDSGRSPVMFVSGAVLFPFCSVPLRIFEPRYTSMLDDALESSRTFILSFEEEDNFEHGVGTMGLIKTSMKQPDGTSILFLEGLYKVNFFQPIQTDADYPVFNYEKRKSLDSKPNDNLLIQLKNKYRELSSKFDDIDYPKDLTFNDMEDCERLLDVFSHNIETKKMIYKMNDAENKASMTLAIIKSILNKI